MVPKLTFEVDELLLAERSKVLTLVSGVCGADALLKDLGCHGVSRKNRAYQLVGGHARRPDGCWRHDKDRARIPSFPTSGVRSGSEIRQFNPLLK
jgi:hypothetical protein